MFKIIIITHYKFQQKLHRVIQRYLRAYHGRRRFKGIFDRLLEVFRNMTKSIKRDGELTNGYTIKYTISMVEITNMDKWKLLDYVLLQFVGTNRQVAYLAGAEELNRKYPDFFFGKFVFAVTMLYSWTCFGKKKLIVEEILSETYEALNILKKEYNKVKKHEIEMKKLGLKEIFSEEETLEALKGIDPLSRFGSKDGNRVDSLLEEVEMLYFRSSVSYFDISH